MAEDKTLTVEPGAEIRFDGYYQINVKGTLNAIGEKENYITFTSNWDNPHVGSWRGISLGNSSENNIIQYAVIEYADRGIYGDWCCETRSIILKNSILRNLNYGVERIGNSNISHNYFLNINYAVFNGIGSGTMIAHNYISNGYETVFNYIYGENNNEIIAENNNINVSTNIDYWFIGSAANATFENNYWGTDDRNYIQSHISEYAINNGVSFEPYADSLITFNLIDPVDNVLLSDPTEINFS